MVTFTHDDDLLDSGLPKGSRCAPVTLGECEKVADEGSYEAMLLTFLVKRVKRLAKENSDLKATLNESASNGGTWPV